MGEWRDGGANVSRKLAKLSSHTSQSNAVAILSILVQLLRSYDQLT